MASKITKELFNQDIGEERFRMIAILLFTLEITSLNYRAGKIKIYEKSSDSDTHSIYRLLPGRSFALRYAVRKVPNCAEGKGGRVSRILSGIS